MNKVIQCPCGYVIHEATDDSLVHAAQAHAIAAHGLELTREQALAMAKPEPLQRRSPHGKGPQV